MIRTCSHRLEICWFIQLTEREINIVYSGRTLMANANAASSSISVG